MAAKKRVQTTTSVGPRGPRGQRGKTGKAGPPGPSAFGELKSLAAQVDGIVKELQVQLTRIAQIQAQLDRIAMGQPLVAVEESRHGGDGPS